MSIRTLAAWELYSERTGEKDISNYLNVGDIVSEDLAYSIMGVLSEGAPPVSYFQIAGHLAIPMTLGQYCVRYSPHSQKAAAYGGIAVVASSLKPLTGIEPKGFIFLLKRKENENVSHEPETS